MTETSVDVFDRAVREATEWLDELDDELRGLRPGPAGTA